MIGKMLLLAVFIVGVSCRYVSIPYRTVAVIDDSADLLGDDLEDVYSEHDFESARPMYVRSRVRRQTGVLKNSNPDGTVNLRAKMPITGNDENVLSAVAEVTALRPQRLPTLGNSYGAVSGGLALDNVKGHGFSVTGKHIPDVADQLTASGRMKVLNNDHHDLSVNAFATKTMPLNPIIPNFNTYGGGVDYKFNDKLGASLSAAHTDLFKRTDYSAMANLNLLKTPSSSLDFNGGYSKSVSPYIPSSNWQPSFGMSFSKRF